MANDIIESNAVAAVNHSIRLNNSLKPEILEGDTYPSWDGDIIVYMPMKNYEERKKEKILGKVPVQVKGTRVEEFSTKERCFDIEVADLRNFLNDGGALFFVVEMTDILDSNATKIYYAELLSVDIRGIMRGKEKQKTIRHTFLELPKNQLYSICRHFLFHREEQGFGHIKLDDKYQFDKYQFKTIGNTRADLDFYLFDSGTYIYGVDEKRNLKVPLYKFVADTKIEQDIFKIGTKDKIYYNKIYREITRKDRRIRFGKSFTLEFQNNNKININFKESGNLSERIKDCEFLIEIMKNNSLVLNKTEISLNIAEQKKAKISEELPKYIEEIKEILETFKKLKITTDEDFDELKKDEKQLMILKNIILNKNNISKGMDEAFHEFHIGTYNILLARSSDKYKNELFNFFNYDELRKRLKIVIGFNEDSENKVEHSTYLLLKITLLYNYSILFERINDKYKNELFNFFNYDELRKKLKIVIVFREDSENKVEHSPYLLLNTNLLYNYSNLNVESVERSLKDVNYEFEISK